LANWWETGLPGWGCQLVVSWWGLGGWGALTLLALPVLEHLHGHEGSTAGDDLVAELGLVIILLVGLVVVVLGVA
jgi:hypothetical protein